MKPRSLNFKIILSTLVVILLVGVASNSIIYSYLSNIILEKANHLEEANLTTIVSQLNEKLEQFNSLAISCSTNPLIAKTLQHHNMNTARRKREFLNMQNILNSNLQASNVKPYLNKLLVFNEDEMTVQLNLPAINVQQDAYTIIHSEMFATSKENPIPNAAPTIAPSLLDGTLCLRYLQPIYDYSVNRYTGWLYMEANLDWIGEALSHYQVNSFLLGRGNDILLSQRLDEVTGARVLAAQESQSPLVLNGINYNLYQAPLVVDDLVLYSLNDISFLEQNGTPLVFTSLVVLITSVLVGLVLIIILTHYVTRPLHSLTHRIHRIAENDFTFDPEIEKGNTELSEAGQLLNQMSGGIKHLLEETEEMYFQRKNSEIALLQSQVNPHFLYNTLDSIHWMATMHQNTGIMTMTHSLSSLMKNLAKGVGDTVPLSKELALLEDYVSIQRIRYLDGFELRNNIPSELMDYGIIKFTLQPIVENAIFHGIVPTGQFGQITLDGAAHEDDILLTIQDQGVGMTAQQIDHLLGPDEAKRSNSQLSGIGVKNVHQRLQLFYGEPYGLSYESQVGEGTKVTIRIPKQHMEEVVHD